ncbi:hypothetical protein GLYMA_02G230000v4 [Glycine max]|uniref:Uncharacterized protein n=1 Tax=Glycine max TaxID=3847 RepID=K7KA85_SOYBN|nr:hypothetical protein JHK87_004981 [Glycine soja]KAG5064135.1 hypothetical protein JHK85_005318 [Glycine max]KAH1061688.1 hypothetical protein GYH30_004930 [Glycine max]KRH72730.1 hypothetical protein GLYMA_02G230000v4 [Glycine max]
MRQQHPSKHHRQAQPPYREEIESDPPLDPLPDSTSASPALAHTKFEPQSHAFGLFVRNVHVHINLVGTVFGVAPPSVLMLKSSNFANEWIPLSQDRYPRQPYYLIRECDCRLGVCEND